MKAMNHKNPFNKEWEKLLNVVNELLKKYSNIILSRTKINPNYIIPKFDDYDAKYLFARRQFRFNHSDCILIANHRNMPYDVELYKPNTTVSIKNYGSNENININIDSKTNKLVFLCLQRVIFGLKERILNGLPFPSPVDQINNISIRILLKNYDTE